MEEFISRKTTLNRIQFLVHLKNQIMKENTEEFNQGFGLLNFDVNEGTINLFQQDLEKNSNSPASYHSIGLAQTYLGIQKQGSKLQQLAIQNLEKAISIAKELNHNGGYTIANENLRWTNEELKTVRKDTSVRLAYKHYMRTFYNDWNAIISTVKKKQATSATIDNS